MKRYSVKPPTEISLDFEDGVSIYLKFDAKALQHANDLTEEQMKKQNPAEMCALIVYMGGCDYNEGLGIEEARRIVSNLDIGTITGLIDDFNSALPDNIVQEAKEAQKEAQKKTTQNFLNHCNK